MRGYGPDMWGMVALYFPLSHPRLSVTLQRSCHVCVWMYLRTRALHCSVGAALAKQWFRAGRGNSDNERPRLQSFCDLDSKLLRCGGLWGSTPLRWISAEVWMREVVCVRLTQGISSSA